MLKKFLSIFLVIFILTGIMLQVSAADIAAIPADKQVNKAELEAKIKKDEAKGIAIKFLKDYCDFNVDEKKYEVRIQYRQNYGIPSFYSSINAYKWDITFQYNEGNIGRYVMVQVDSNTGKITGFNRNDYNYSNREQAKVPTITEEQAGEVAKAFIEKVYPGISSQLVKNDNNYLNYIYKNISSPQYNFNYTRLVNGIKFDVNSVNVSVNGHTGNVSAFSCNWSDNLSFPSSETKLDGAKAGELFMKEAEMKLSYVDNRGISFDPYTQPTNVNLAYGAEFKNGNMIDAKNGNITKVTIAPNPVIQTKDLTPAEKEKFISSWKELKPLTQELDEKQATSKANEYIEKLLGKDYEINSTSYDDGNRGYSYQTGKSAWQIQFTSKKADDIYNQPSGTLTIDAASGQLISISKFNRIGAMSTEQFTPKLSWEEAYNKAINVLSETYPDKVKDIITEQSYVQQVSFYNDIKLPESYYAFYFTRTVNGLSYGTNNISMNIDIKTGEITQLRCNWDNNLKFPEIKGVLSKEDAKQQFFKAFSPELVYQLNKKDINSDNDDYEVMLVYRLKPSSAYLPLIIDAYTGNPLDYSENAVNKYKKFKEIIKGHWGEKEFEALALQGVIDMESFKPDIEITRMDALKILLKIKGYPYYSNTSQVLNFTNIDSKSSNYKYIQTAVEYGLIDNVAGEFKGDEKITREEMAELLVRLLKYNKLAKSKNIFNLTYSDAVDISPDKYGYVAVGTGLEILSGDNGKFRPKDNATSAEFVVSVYKMLDLLKD